jgi:hypothetical protein
MLTSFCRDKGDRFLDDVMAALDGRPEAGHGRHVADAVLRVWVEKEKGQWWRERRIGNSADASLRMNERYYPAMV